MARRDLQEINAGSMADIAFLLLIFFLVTTTMEVDAGIARQLPLKRDTPPEDIIIHDRDVLLIKANSRDELFIEGEVALFEDLEEIVLDFYTANINGETDETLPAYADINIPKCQEKIVLYQQAVEDNPDDTYLKDDLAKWETKLRLCQELPTGQYQEISKMAMIRLENQSGTSYGLYIQIQNVLKRVVNKLRTEKCDEIWGREYFTLDDKDPIDQDIIKKLRVLVPERIIEAKIER